MKISKKEIEICRKKRVYRSMNKARYTAGLLKKAHPERGKLEAYRCPVCRKYHLTSEPREYMKKLRWLRINNLFEKVNKE